VTINIVGFSSTNKVPGFFGETVYRAGPISVGDIPLILLLSGNKLSTGSATPDQDIDDIQSLDQSDALHGAGCELNLMCRAALRVPGVKIKAAASAEAGGAVAATLTITIAGSWTTSGEWRYRIDGVPFSGGIAATDSVTNVATAIVAAVQADSHMPCSAANVAGVVTLTRKSKGTRGNDGTAFQDISALPSGATSTLGGAGAAVTGPGLHFGAGTGTDNVTTLLTKILPGRYHRNAVAQADSSNIVRWRDQAVAKAGVLEGRMEHIVVAVSGTLGAATSLASATINAERVQLLHYLHSENHPSELAAVFGAIRTATEQDDPDAAFDDVVLTGVAPQSQAADWPTMANKVSALDNGVTPITTTPDGYAVVVRSIVTHCLLGATPDYRVLDTSQAVVPDYVRDGLGLLWTTQFKVGNPKVNSDPAPTARERPAGVATPKRWSQFATNYLLGLEAALILTDVALNPVVSEYNATAKRIMSIVPVIPAANQHQIGVSVRQVG
jgi:phage tail sheath gpL-like